MKHVMFVPEYLPLPVIGSWYYLIVPDLNHPGIEYHSCGKVLQAGYGGFHQNYIEYKETNHPKYCSRPL